MNIQVSLLMNIKDRLMIVYEPINDVSDCSRYFTRPYAAAYRAESIRTFEHR
jgi:hypothetical protein